jgi:hypothetical protein
LQLELLRAGDSIEHVLHFWNQTSADGCGMPQYAAKA